MEPRVIAVPEYQRLKKKKEKIFDKIIKCSVEIKDIRLKECKLNEKLRKVRKEMERFE